MLPSPSKAGLGAEAGVPSPSKVSSEAGLMPSNRASNQAEVQAAEVIEDGNTATQELELKLAQLSMTPGAQLVLSHPVLVGSGTLPVG